MQYTDERIKLPLNGQYGEFFLFKEDFIDNNGSKKEKLSVGVLIFKGNGFVNALRVSGALNYRPIENQALYGDSTHGLWIEEAVDSIPDKKIIDAKIEGIPDLSEDDLIKLYNKCYTPDFELIPREAHVVAEEDRLVIEHA